MKNKSFWIYKGIIYTYDSSSNKITKQFVKGKIIIEKISNIFYIITVQSKNNSYSNIFMSNNEQIIGSFFSNDYTTFYITTKGKLKAKFYTLTSNSKTNFGEFKLFPN